MEKKYTGKEKRAFVRYEHKRPMHFSTVASPRERNIISKFISSISKNISASGILFTTKNTDIPDLSSLLILDLDYKLARACAAVEKRALIVNNKLLGKVVRVVRRSTETDVGVAFVTKSDRLSEDIKKRI